jgi:hypothetical protein
MKRVILFVVLNLSFIAVHAQIKVNSTGKVGINNTSPTYQLDVSGNFRVNDSGNALIYSAGLLYSNSSSSMLGDLGHMWNELYAYQAYFYYCDVYYSDASLKTDIKELSSAKDKLKALRPVSYRMKTPMKACDAGDAKTEAEQIGFIAQEMQAVFPEIVVADKNGVLGIRYTELIPVLVKALQEQQQVIDDLTKRVEALEAAKK